MSDVFDPKKIIDFSKDYYAILNLSKTELPFGSDRKSKIELTNKLDQSFRKMARVCHPDFGGSKEAFLDIVRARRIIEDPILRKIYDQGEFTEVIQSTESNSGFEVDWTKIGTYRKGTTEDTVGYSLFLSLCERKTELDIIPAFIPDNNEHNYEWDFVLNNHKQGQKIIKVVISIVNDESEVLRLTSGDDVKDSLPFKIYVCIPKIGVRYVRDDTKIVSPFGNVLKNGAIKSVEYNDHHFLETTSLDEAKEYLKSEQFKLDLDDFRINGSNQKHTSKSENTWMDKDQMKKFDAEQLNVILKMKTIVTEANDSAADFLEKLGENTNISKDLDKPELPI
jgi:hypothetical protein